MKILCTGDWHVHSFTDYAKTLTVKWSEESLRYVEVEPDESDSGIKEMNSRLFNVLKGICDMRDYCLTHGITHILMSGDMFHKRANIEVVVFNATYKVLNSFSDCGIMIHAIAGNHDDVDSSQIPVTSIHSFKEIIHVIEKPVKFDIPDEDRYTEVVAIPYSKDKQFVLESMNKLREECTDPERAILLCHLGLTGGKVGSGMYVMSDEYSLGDLKYSSWKYVVCGHYHQPQLLDYNVFYCGTPVQNSFNDELPWENGYNGFFVVDTSKKYDIEFVPITSVPRFITFTSAEDLEYANQELLQSNYVRVKASAEDVEEIKDTLDDLLGEDNTQEIRLELEKNYDTESRSDIGVSMSFADSVKVYATEQYKNPENLSKAIDVGLSILSEAQIGGN